MLNQEANRPLDAERARPPAGEAVLQGEDLALRRQRYELNKAVERMRRAAELYNQPLEFAADQDQLKIRARDRRSGAGREFTLEEAAAWLAELDGNKGNNINGYA